MAFPRIEGYVVTERLGSGSYSTVYKAYKKVGPRQTVAVKCVDKKNVRASVAADNLLTEIRLLKTLKHPHIVAMHDFTWDDKNIYIIMEYCAGGDLAQYIRKSGRVQEHKARYFLQQLVSALQYLYNNHVAHRDLKPHNLLLHKGYFRTPAIKVADFGFAQYLDSADTSSLRGSPLYMAPEMFAGKYDHRADLWSVGVILYEMLFGSAPYSSPTLGEMMQKVNTRAPITLPPNSSISPGCRNLLFNLLQHDVDKRLTHEQLFADDYLDLQHMPTREHYNEGVLLLNRAVEAERTDLQAALNLYREALELLVPCVICFDEASKQALHAKLNTYMERAEEIKRILKQDSLSTSKAMTNAPLNPTADLPPTGDLSQCEYRKDDENETIELVREVSDTENPKITSSSSQNNEKPKKLDRRDSNCKIT